MMLVLQYHCQEFLVVMREKNIISNLRTSSLKFENLDATLRMVRLGQEAIRFFKHLAKIIKQTWRQTC